MHKNKIIIAIGLVGVLIVVTGLSFLLQAKPPLAQVFDAKVAEVLEDTELQVELEAARAKINTFESQVSNILLEKDRAISELSILRAKVAELIANQQPELSAQYSQLRDRYNRQTIELQSLKATYDTLLLKYEKLVRMHALCEDGGE